MAEAARSSVRFLCNSTLNDGSCIYRHINFANSRQSASLDHEERSRKKIAREAHKASKDAQTLKGHRAKLLQQRRHKEKIEMKKQIRMRMFFHLLILIPSRNT